MAFFPFIIGVGTSTAVCLSISTNLAVRGHMSGKSDGIVNKDINFKYQMVVKIIFHFICKSIYIQSKIYYKKYKLLKEKLGEASFGETESVTYTTFRKNTSQFVNLLINQTNSIYDSFKKFGGDK